MPRDRLPRRLRGRLSDWGEPVSDEHPDRRQTRAASGGRLASGVADSAEHEARILRETERVQAELRARGLDPAMQDGKREKISRANRKRRQADEQGGGMPELIHERMRDLAQAAGYFQARERLTGDGYALGMPVWISFRQMTTVAARRRCPRCQWPGLIAQPYVRGETFRVLQVCPACNHARLV